MPRLTSTERAWVCSKIREGGWTLSGMAKALSCSIPTIVRVRDNMGVSATEQSSGQCDGRVPTITDCMRDRLRERLSEHPETYLEEMRALLLNEFDVLVSTSTISRSLRSMQWSKKLNRRRAKEQNPDLRDFYMYTLSQLRSWQLVFLDETGCDRLVGFRKKGWAPRGVTPVQIARFHPGKGTRSCPRTAKMASYWPRCSKETRTVLCLRSSLSSFCHYVGDGPSHDQCSSWITHQYIIRAV